MRVRRRKLMLMLIGGGGLVVVLLLVFLFVILSSRGDDTEASVAEVTDLLATPTEVAENDPWAGLEETAIQRVQSHAVALPDETQTSVLQRIDDGMLQSQIELFALLGLAEGEWVATRPDDTVYAVQYRFAANAVEVGPRWLVQLDPDGPSGGSADGVVAANALARFVEAPDPGELERFMNRSDEVVEAMTNHQFEGGTRLAAALLIYFLGSSDDSTDQEIIGWVVVPDEIVPDEQLLYQAFFQWRQAGELQVAQWEINLQNGEFIPRNLLAGEIMNRGNEVEADDLMSILPESIQDPQADPSDERSPILRALRYVLHSDRLLEAVSALLTFRARSTELEYISWTADPTDEERVYDVSYNFTEGGEGCIETCREGEECQCHSVSWRVNANSGEVTPTSDISQTADRMLRIQASNSEAPEAGGEGGGETDEGGE